MATKKPATTDTTQHSRFDFEAFLNACLLDEDLRGHFAAVQFPLKTAKATSDFETKCSQAKARMKAIAQRLDLTYAQEALSHIDRLQPSDFQTWVLFAADVNNVPKVGG